MRWGPRHDFTLGDVRLFSYTTGTQQDGTEDMLFTGYGEPSRRQHPYFSRQGNQLAAGGTVLSQGGEQLSNLSLDSQGPALIASVEGIYDAGSHNYDVKFVEVIPGSNISSVPWEARPPRYEGHQLPGEVGRSYRWDVTLGVGDQVSQLQRIANKSSMATVVSFLPESSGALLIEGHAL